MPKGASDSPVIESPDQSALRELQGSIVRVVVKDKPDPIEGKVALVDDRDVVVLENRGQMIGQLICNLVSVQKIKRFTLSPT